MIRLELRLKGLENPAKRLGAALLNGGGNVVHKVSVWHCLNPKKWKVSHSNILDQNPERDYDDNDSDSENNGNKRR